MKKHYYLFLLLLLSLAGCKKYNHLNDDIKGQLYIRGRLTYADNLDKGDSIISQPLAGKMVDIGYARDSAANFIYSVKTDSNGYFQFNNLSPDSAYLVFAKDSESGIVYFNQKKETLSVSLDTVTLTLMPSETFQNGLFFNVTDNSKPAGKPLSGCTVCLSLSRILLQTDTCVGATYSLTTNAYGNAYQLNVPQGRYYALFRGIYGKDTLKAQDSIDVHTTGIARKGPVIVK